MSHPSVVLGIDFGGTKIAAAVCDLAGNKLADAVVDSQAALGARACFQHGVKTAKGLLAGIADNADDGSAVDLAAVGVATFGIPYEDRVELAPAIEGWDSWPLGRELRTAFPGTHIRMATDVKAAALAEARWGSLIGADPAIYLNLGTGLAAAIVSREQVLLGSHGAAGEIGYYLRQRSDVGLPTGSRVLLEDMVSGQGLRLRASTAQQQMTAAEVFAASTGPDDVELEALVEDFVNELAFHVVNLAILVNPARIAVGGGMTRSWDRIGPTLTQALRAAVPYPPELVLAHFPHEAPLLGAVALAVDAASNNIATIALSNGHYRANRTNNASTRPSGNLPAGTPQATSHSG
ncbi:MAG TPA: ROK family protein [Streptosporangiaceae bacterium]|nr:ROK family protein [Streptosporangiaceae bacterium]